MNRCIPEGSSVPAGRPAARHRLGMATWILLLALLVPGLTGCGGEGDAGPRRFSPIGAGDPAPAFAAATLDGDTLSLAALQGEAVLLNIWATWCLPCREEMPGLQRLHEELGAQGLRVVGVSIDGRAAGRDVRDFLTSYGISFTILHDPEERVTRAFRTTGVPETFLIDRNGRIVRRWIGLFDPTSAEARASVDQALAPADGSA
ncbi:MAG TPA: TlpA disulfide reductase family protein [Longimicrobiaceae bacterium]|nr:TlpA disulfide reductase family protein [Longimicrobiaceae bacterium]